MRSNLNFFLLFFALVIIDQAAKISFPVSLCNKNIAWSIPVAPAIFYIVWIMIAVALVNIFFRTKNPHQKVFVSLVLSGAVSNFIDRVRLGCVVDYLELGIFPVFNLADIYITTGTLFFILIVALRLQLKR